MSPTLPSSCRRRRTLSPHGYEGRRAESRPLPALAAVDLPPLPGPAELARLGVTFEPVGFGTGPVRVRCNGLALGVFANAAAAAPALLRLAQ
jgi:hypothetical protein